MVNEPKKKTIYVSFENKDTSSIHFEISKIENYVYRNSKLGCFILKTAS